MSLQAWNGVDGIPLAVVMSVFMLLYKMQNIGLIDFSQTSFRTFETPDPSLDDANHTNSSNNGVSLYRDFKLGMVSMGLL